MEKILLAGIVLCGFMLLMSLIDGSDSSGEDTRTGGPSGCGWLMILALIAAALFMTGCAETPPIDTPFPGASGWTERRANPGRVNHECAQQNEAFGAEYCGCTVFDKLLVWTARTIDCNRKRTQDHERCHVETGPSKAAVAACHRKHRPQRRVAL